MVLNVDLQRVWTVRPEQGSKCHPKHQFSSASRWHVPMIHESAYGLLIIRVARAGDSSTKKWEAFIDCLELPIQKWHRSHHIMSPSILVLVQIPLNRNRLMCAPKMLRDGYHPMSIVFVWGEFLSVSWISFQYQGGFLLRTLSEQVQIGGAHWPLLSMKLMIKILFNVSPTFQLFYHFWESFILVCLRSQVCATSNPWRWLSYLCLQQIPSSVITFTSLPVILIINSTCSTTAQYLEEQFCE